MTPKRLLLGLLKSPHAILMEKLKFPSVTKIWCTVKDCSTGGFVRSPFYTTSKSSHNLITGTPLVAILEVLLCKATASPPADHQPPNGAGKAMAGVGKGTTRVN